MAIENMELHMASQVESFLEEFSYFYSKDVEKFTNALTNLVILAANSEEELKTVSSQINMDVLFSAICTDDDDSRRLLKHDACKLLGYVFSTYSSYDAMKRFDKRIMESVNVDIKEYQVICLKQVLKFAEDDKFDNFSSNPEILFLTIKYLGSEDTGISRTAVKILSRLTDYEENISKLFSTKAIELFAGLMNLNATVRFRVYEVFIDFLQKFPHNLDMYMNTQILDRLMNDLYNGNDILSQLGALDIVSQLALTGQKGMMFVEDKNILKWLETTIISDDPLGTFLLPGAIKCFGSIAGGNPSDIISRYQSIVDAIFGNLKNYDATIRCLCAETIAFICSSGDAMKLLYSRPDLLKNAVKTMGQIVTSPAESELAKTRVLESLAKMIAHDPHDVEISMICEKLFQYISSDLVTCDPVTYIFNLAQQPFMDVRYGALEIFKNVSVFSWVEQDMALCAGFMEYLLDRGTESEKKGRELKYQIIKNLSLSNTSKANLGLTYYDKVVQYTKDGPFYQESQVAVTYEQQD